VPVNGAALVTGAARRVGRTLALRLAAEGYDVAVHANTSRHEAEAVCEEIRALGRKAVCVTADLSTTRDFAPLMAEASAALGPLSVLVNNASTFRDDRVGTLSADLWDDHLSTNLRAPVLLAEAFAAQAPDGSLIVNLIDQRVLKPNPQFFSYSLSKAGLWFATRTLAQALAPRIRVNGIGPGPTLASIHQDPAEFAAEAATVPLGRGTTPDELAEALLYFLRAPSVTGQMLCLDGGQHLAWQTPDLAFGGG
jgi:NAD(P)-dependent dehydrogenase (short-subunit alcohol dehydrogenase family)